MKTHHSGEKADTLYFTEYTLSNLKGDSYDGTIPLCKKCNFKCVASTNKADRWMKNVKKSGKKRRW